MKQILLSILVLGSSVAINAQIHTINRYLAGTRITYYVGECGNDIPEAVGKIHFCDDAGNQAVVENSFGLNSNAVQKMGPNYYNDDLLFVTSNGLSIQREDGTWDNLPNRAIPKQDGDPGSAWNSIDEAIYLPDGQIIFLGDNLGSQVMQYDPVSKEIISILMDTVTTNSIPRSMTYDADRDLVWVLVGSNWNKKLYSIADGLSTQVHDLGTISFDINNPRDRWVYDNDALWMAKTDSLVKIDLLNGYAETTYDNSTTGLLPFDGISDIEIDAEGMLWLSQVESNMGGITRFNPVTEQYDLYQIEDEDGDFNVRFESIGIDPEGHVWGVSDNFSGIYELDVSSTDPVWTVYAEEEFDALGLPYSHIPLCIHTQNGKTYFTIFLYSDTTDDPYEILVREGGVWSGINDNVESNFSQRMARASYIKPLSNSEGGVWWLGLSHGQILYLKDENEFTFEHDMGYVGSGHGSINAAGDLTVRIGTDIGLFEDGVFTPYETIPGITLTSTVSAGNTVWAWITDFSNGLLVRYVDGAVTDQYPLDELANHQHYAPLSNGDLIFVKSSLAELTIQRFDHLTEMVTLEYSLSTNGPLREIIAGENGSYWVIEGKQLSYFDGTGADPLVLNEDNTSLEITNIGNAFLGDAVLDTDMNLYVMQGYGRLNTFSPPYSDLELETIELNGENGIMPFQQGVVQGFHGLSLDSEGDLWTSVFNGLVELKDDNPASEFHVDAVVGLEDFGPSTLLWGLRLYPNPGTDYIEFDATEDLDHVIVYDLLGQVVSAHSLRSSSRIDVGELPTGIYLLELESQNGFTQTVKWIKE